LALKGEVMKSKKRLVLVILVVCVVLVGWYIAAAGEPVRASTEPPPTATFVLKQRDILKGLTGVYVVVEEMNPEVVKIGLTKEVILTDVELEFRRFGIRVLSKDESLAMPGLPFFYVNVNAALLRGDRLWGSVIVQLNEVVFLRRQPILCSASTWKTQMSFSSYTEQEVRGVVKERVDEFINDYLAANPKETVAAKDVNDSK
jgi:hypothetical protein